MKAVFVWVGLLGTCAMHAQPSWQQFFMPASDFGCVVRDLTEHPSGDVHAVLFEVNPYNVTGSRLVHLQADGQFLGDVVLEGEGAFAMELLINPEGSLWVVAVPDQVNNNGIALIRFTPQLAHLGTTTVLQSQQYGIQSVQACMDVDGLLTVGLNRVDWNSVGSQAYCAVQFTPQGDSLRSAVLREYIALGSVNSIAPHPSGGYVYNTTGSFWGDTATVVSAGYITYLNDTLGVLGSLALPHVDPAQTTPYNSPQTPSHTVCLDHGELLVSGMYWPIPSDYRGCVLQHLDSTAHVLRQWVSTGPELMDHPAENTGFDRTPEGHVYIAQVENHITLDYFYPYLWDWPNRVHLFKLNDQLEQMAEYVIDGSLDDTYHHLSGVKAAADGGVFVYGSVCSTQPGSHPRAWVRKIGPDELVGMAEVEQRRMLLHPNPGSEGFQIILMEPVTDAVLTMMDAQGRVCLSSPLNGLVAAVGTGHLAAGLYAVRVNDRRGHVLHTGKWIKE